DGERCEPSMAPIDTYDDHRMALSFAPLAMKYPEIKINNPLVVTKSYPAFWNDMKQAGFTIDTI
ncbi:MAG: 3-phosphoshikimate 1-carboxyvinyltransferase, partial [Prevotella sp.]|nr:3-phosphoshikimate 1-carboxyvinyltransferase [Prevotella sp.]